jgi:hypothetical protein
MFSSWAHFNKILVTGPRRSGTTIASRMVAADTGHRFVDESDYRWGSLSRFERILAEPDPMVIQCPNFCHLIEPFARIDRLIVFMKRDVAHIVRSQRRIGWTGAWSNKLRYRYKVAPWTLLRPISEIRYIYWRRYQRHQIPHYLEQDYEALSQHRLWLDPDQRQDFKPKQTAATHQPTPG